MTLFLHQRRRIFDEDNAPAPEYPAQVTAEVTFAPEDAFGVLSTQARTTMPEGKNVRLHWNINEGLAWIEGEIIDPVLVSAAEKGLDMSFQGNVLTVRFIATSLQDVHGVGEWIVLMLPPCLTMRLRVAIWITMFLFDVGGKQYTFGVRNSGPGTFKVATTNSVSSEIAQSLRDAFLIEVSELRIISAIHYYRHALRLFGLDPDRESLVAEVILNLTKAVEIIASDKRDKIREVATALGYDSDDVERQIIPLTLIRSKLDVAHVATGPLSESERAVVHSFVTSAFSVVSEFIERALAGVRAGTITLNPISSTLDTEKRKLLEDLANYS